MKRARLSGALVLAVVATGVTLPVSSAVAAGSDLYVDNQLAACSNSGPGTAAQPYCSLQIAADAAQPGDTVHVLGAGQAQYGDVTFTHSGTPRAPIAIVGSGYEHLTSLSVEGAHDLRFQDVSSTTVRLGSAQDVTLDGLDVIAGSAPTAVEIGGDSSQVTLSRSAVYDAGTAVQVDPGSSGVVVTTDWISAAALGVHVSGAAGVDVVSNTLDGGGSAAPVVTVDQASTGTVVENNVSGGPLVVASDSTPGTKVDYNLGYTVNGSPLYRWAGQAIGSVADFRTASGQGAHDLSGGAWTATENPRLVNPLQVDSADAQAPGELSTDIRGAARVDDPTVPNSGTGVGYYDRGAEEEQDPFQAKSPTLWPDNLAYGATATFTSADSNPWGSAVSRTYDFGDGTPTETTTNAVVHHVYAAVPGGGSKRYQVTITETSPADGTKQSFTLWETVNPPGPLKVYYPRLGAEPAAPLTVDFTGADFQSPFTIASCTADFGDASKPVTGNCWNLPHTYARAGLYSVHITATDAGGQTASFQQSISVGPQFVRTTPVTTLDTYHGTGAAKGTVAPGHTLRLKVAGVAGVPRNATSVRLNVTASGAGAQGSVTAYAEGTARPSLPTVLYPARQASSSLVDVPVGADGYVDLANLSGRAYVTAEVEGFDTLTPGTQGLVFVPEASMGYPTQWIGVFDTEMGRHPAEMGPGATARFNAVPGPSSPNTLWNAATGEGSRLVELSVTTSASTAFSHLTFQGGPGAGPGADGVYVYRGQEHTTTLLVPVAPDGTVTVHNAAGRTDVIVEVEGFYLSAAADAAPANQAMVQVRSTPVFDTLTGLGVRRGPVAAHGTVWVKVAGVAGVPAGATEVAVRLAALNTHYSGTINDDRSYGNALTMTAGQNTASLVYLPVVNGSIKLDAGSLSPFDLTASVEGYSAG